MIDRRQLRSVLTEFIGRVESAHWAKSQPHILKVLSDPKVFMYHVTDDIFRCAFCQAEDTHRPDCVVNQFAELRK